MVTGVVLFFLALEDLRNKSVRIWHLGSGAAIILCLGELEGVWPKDALWGLIPGFLLLALSIFGRKVIGAADGIVFLLLGLLYGLWESLSILLYSLGLFCLWAIVLLLAKKITYKDRLPFLPFVLGGYLLYFLPGFIRSLSF